jgi:general secretion pathway protein K
MIRPEEEGAALLTVLLLVAIMAAMSAVALEQLRFSERLVGNGVAIDQGRAYAMGAEAFAAAHISELSPDNGSITTLAGGWKDRPIHTAVPGGGITLRLGDGGNCFNLNSVAQGSPESGLTPRQQGIDELVALFLQLGVGATDTRIFVASLADWLDSDGQPNPEGAEDEYYAKRPTPYRTANRMLADVSEIRAIRGMNAEIYDRVSPWLCALPNTDLSPINVNTLDVEQAPLIVMMMPDSLDLSHAREILARRPVEGWTSIDQFWKVPALQAIVPPMEVQGQAQLKTRWFTARLDVDVAGSKVVERVLIDAGPTPPKILQRRWGDDS